MWLWYLQTPLSNAKFGVESDERHQKSIWNVIPLQNQTFRAKTCLAHPNSIGGAPSVWKITFFMNLDTTWFQTDADQVYRWNLKWCSLAVVLLKRRARVTSSSTLPAFPPRPWHNYGWCCCWMWASSGRQIGCNPSPHCCRVYLARCNTDRMPRLGTPDPSWFGARARRRQH